MTGLVASWSIGAGAGAQGSVRGVSDDSITVAGLTDNQQPEASEGAEVVFKAVNDDGGIAGRQIDYLGGNNDKNDATEDLNIGRRLVQQDQVFAVVPVVTPTFGAGEFFEQQKVPVFGWAIATAFCDATYLFGFTGCIVPPPPVKTAGSTWGELINVDLEGKGEGGADGKSAAVISEDNDSGKTGHKVIAASAKSVGMDVTYSKASVPAPPAVVGDYSPYVNDIMTSADGEAPDVVFLVTSFTNVVGLAKALQAAGFEGIITNAVAYHPGFLNPSGTGISAGQTPFTQFAIPESAPDNPNMQKILDQIEQYAPDAQVTQGFLAGYFSADFFEKALKKAGKNLTPDTLAKAVNKMTYQIKGVVGPTKYPYAQNYGTPCGALAESNGTEYSVVAPYACYDNITLKGLKPIPYGESG
jgi:ABC-type branched-subunit amino acid transport system substrate-binding protein